LEAEDGRAARQWRHAVAQGDLLFLFASVAEQRLDFVLVLRGILEDGANEIARGEDAITEGSVTVRFREDADAVTETEVVRTVARDGRDRFPELVVTREVAIKERLVAAAFLQPPADIRQHLIAHEGDQLRIAGRADWPFVGDG